MYDMERKHAHPQPSDVLWRNTPMYTHCRANVLQAEHPGAFTGLPGFTLLHTQVHVPVLLPLHLLSVAFQALPWAPARPACHHTAWAIWPGMSVCRGTGRRWRKGGVRRQTCAALSTGRRWLLSSVQYGGWWGASPSGPSATAAPPCSSGPLCLFFRFLHPVHFPHLVLHPSHHLLLLGCLCWPLPNSGLPGLCPQEASSSLSGDP